MRSLKEARKFWNEQFSGNHYKYGKQPNVFFKEQLDKLKPGNLLMPAEGEGRNALHAARQGWKVDAFDLSEKARKKALELAKRFHTTIHYTTSSYQDYEIEAETYDAIGLIYAHIHESVRRKLHRKLIRGLKPGGVLILEGFAKEQQKYDSGGPGEPEMLYSKEELVKDFEALDIIIAESVQVTLAEGNSHQGEAHVVRLVAQKPDSTG